MDIVDLTVEATFVLGAAVFAHLMILHVNQYCAMLLGIGFAAFIGVVVAVIQKITKLDSLITSILAVFMLYSINFKVMGRPNINLLSVPTFIQQLQYDHPNLLLMGLFLAMIVVVLIYFVFIKSELGLLLRVFGDNRSLLVKLSKNDLVLLATGLAISNALAGFSGVLTAQFNGYADINMGKGVALTAIGAMIVGVTLVNYCRQNACVYKAPFELFGCFIGVVFYFLIMNLLLSIGIDPIYMKLALGAVLLVFLSIGQANKNRRRYA